MATHTINFTKPKGLFFDIYATLIDWGPAMYSALSALTHALPENDGRRADTLENRQALLRVYATNEKEVEAEFPTMPYPKILQTVYARLASQFGVNFKEEDAVRFGYSIGERAAFPDTVAAMQVLDKHYKLFALSDVDNGLFRRTIAGPLEGVKFDSIYTAQMIGPDDFGVEKETLIVAQSLDIYHVASTALGLQPGIWIARNIGVTTMGGNYGELLAAGKIKIGAKSESLGDMVSAVERAFQS